MNILKISTRTVIPTLILSDKSIVGFYWKKSQVLFEKTKTKIKPFIVYRIIIPKTIYIMM